MIKPLKAPLVPECFPLELKHEHKPKGFFQRIKYKYFVSPFTYVFTEDYTIHLTKEHSITITKGFETDLSSVPPFLWWLLPPIREESGNAPLAHDWGYAKDVYRDLMGWFINKVWWDYMMLRLEKEAPLYDYWLRFWGVLIFGWGVYFRRAEEQKKKESVETV